MEIFTAGIVTKMKDKCHFCKKIKLVDYYDDFVLSNGNMIHNIHVCNDCCPIDDHW